MDQCGIFDHDSKVILSHANHLAPSDTAIVKQKDVYLSSAPSVELQMGMGTPSCFDPVVDIQSHSSLGVDCHNVVLASIVQEMRTALTFARGSDHAKFMAQGKMAAAPSHSVQDAYALGTIQGARAVGMQDQIGSLAVGKKADIIVFDGLAPSMICGSQQDPVTAIVMHSTPGDICMTFVDGILRKSESKLLPVQLEPADASIAGVADTQVFWAQVAEQLLKCRESVAAQVDSFDLEAAKPIAVAAFGMDPSMIVSKL